ncbi:MAG: hypothetical protein ACE5JS_08790 [Nitrospinota bacterium]
MVNKKTTIAGYLVVVGAAASFLAKVIKTGEIDPSLWQEIMAGAAGIGLIGARDGGH